MKIGLISYDTSHLKSEQVINGFLKKNYIMTIFLLPFLKRSKRKTLIKHRPNQKNAIDIKIICDKHNIDYVNCNDDSDIKSGLDYYVILGAGILSKDCVIDKKIINCHPGIIPSVRGLDSFKFSILNKIKLGVSLHFIDENVDEGEIFSTIETPVYKTDSLKTLSRRHYENEISILINFEKYLKNNSFVKDDFPKLPSTMRMKVDDEKNTISNFNEYRNIFSCKDKV